MGNADLFDDDPLEASDNDGDIGDNTDPDDDDDGTSDLDEIADGTDPRTVSADQDVSALTLMRIPKLKP